MPVHLHKLFIALFCVLAVVFCQQQEHQQPIVVKTSITSAQNTRATIFAAGKTAIVERTFPLTIPVAKTNKMYNIIVEHVSSVIQQDSLLLRLDYDKNKATATILDYSIRSVGKQGAKTKDLLLEKTDLERKRHSITCHLNRVKKANEIMEKSISQVAGKGEAVEERLDVYMKKAEDNDAKIVDLEEQIKVLNDKIASLQSQIADQEKKSYSEISINVRIDSHLSTSENLSLTMDLPISLTVLYQVANVEWTPSYILKIDSSTLSGNLEFGTSIIQQSGEDWKNAKITLSTAKPSSGGSPPTVTPQFVHAYGKYSSFDSGIGSAFVSRSAPSPFSQQKIQNSYGQQQNEANIVGNAGAGYSNVGNAGAAPEAWDQADTASIGRVAYSDLTDIVTYEISQEMYIASREDSQAQQATIATIDLNSAVFEHLIIPSKDKQVYMKLTSKNQSKYPLLTGPMNILIDQQLVSRTQLKPMSNIEGGLILPGKMFETFVGTDKSVTVTSQPWKSVEEEAGSLFTFNKRNTITKTRELVINNKKGIPINVTIIDAIPKPANSEIQFYLKSPVIHYNDMSSIKTSVVDILKEYNEKNKESNESKQPQHHIITACYDSSNTLDKECNIKENGGIRVSLDQQFILKQNFALKAKKSKELKLEYTMEFPTDKNLGYY